MATTSPGSEGRIVLGVEFKKQLELALPRLLAPGALPDDWDPRATTYDLTRFDSDGGFAARFAAVLSRLVAEPAQSSAQIREALITVGLPFDYARLGQPLSTLFELWVQSHTNAARCFSFASVTKPWLAVIESPLRTLKVRVYADHLLPVSDEKRAALRGDGVVLHERWEASLPAASADFLTVFVTAKRFTGDVSSLSADAICFPVMHGGVLLLRDPSRIVPSGIQLVRKRTVSALIASDARTELELAAGVTPTRFAEATLGLGRLQLDHREVIDLLLALAIAERMRSPLLLSSLRGLRQKIGLAFPPEERVRVSRLRRRIFHGPPASGRITESMATPKAAVLGPIQDGFFEQRTIEIEYSTTRERTTRRVEPQYLCLAWPVWYLLVWDHLRGAVRWLRLDRIEAARLTEEPFQLRDIDEMMLVARDLFTPV